MGTEFGGSRELGGRRGEVSQGDAREPKKPMRDIRGPVTPSEFRGLGRSETANAAGDNRDCVVTKPLDPRAIEHKKSISLRGEVGDPSETRKPMRDIRDPVTPSEFSEFRGLGRRETANAAGDNRD